MCEKYEISISCKNLPNFDKLSKSDPKVFLFIENRFNNNSIDSEWKELKCTETIQNNCNPVFKEKLEIDYYPNSIQNLRFIVFDMDDNSKDWKKNDFMGYFEKSLTGLINGCKDNVYTADLLTSIPSGFNISNSKAQNFKQTSKIMLRVEKITGPLKMIRFSISGSDFDRMDLFGKCDPFIEVSLPEDNEEESIVFQTSVRPKTLNPTWEKLEVPVKVFNKGDPDKMLTFKVYDSDAYDEEFKDKGTKRDLVGVFKATTNDLFSNQKFEIINPKLKNNNNYSNSGTVVFNKIEYFN